MKSGIHLPVLMVYISYLSKINFQDSIWKFIMTNKLFEL